MDPPYAGIVSRSVALVIDAVLLTVVTSVVVLGPPRMWASLAGAPPLWVPVLFQVVGMALPVAYFTLCWWATGQTLGGMGLAIAVRRANGERLGLARSALRAAAGLLFAPLWLAGMALILLDRRRRAAHDLLFDTVVLRRPARLDAAAEPR